jgi:hypothetical protein
MGQSRRPGSNRRPPVYKTGALPAELRRRGVRILPPQRGWKEHHPGSPRPSGEARSIRSWPCLLARTLLELIGACGAPLDVGGLSHSVFDGDFPVKPRAAHAVGSARRVAHGATCRDCPLEGSVDETPVRDSRLAATEEFLAGSAERASWTQLGGHPAAGVADPGERNQTSAGDEHGCDCVRNTEGMHGRVLEGRS